MLREQTLDQWHLFDPCWQTIAKNINRANGSKWWQIERWASVDKSPVYEMFTGNKSAKFENPIEQVMQCKRYKIWFPHGWGNEVNLSQARKNKRLHYAKYKAHPSSSANQLVSRLDTKSRLRHRWVGEHVKRSSNQFRRKISTERTWGL